MQRKADPDFLYAALERLAGAAFMKESRMNFASATSYTENPGEAGKRSKNEAYNARSRAIRSQRGWF